MSATSVSDRALLARHDAESYQRAWREVRFDQLTAELARQSHRIAGVNREKLAALGRLFGGLVVMVGLSALYGGLRP